VGRQQTVACSQVTGLKVKTKIPGTKTAAPLSNLTIIVLRLYIFFFFCSLDHALQSMMKGKPTKGIFQSRLYI
jgi:hypothetical protein